LWARIANPRYRASSDPATNKTSLIAHSIAEQYEKQVNGLGYDGKDGKPGAHDLAVKAEESITGYTQTGGNNIQLDNRTVVKGKNFQYTLYSYTNCLDFIKQGIPHLSTYQVINNNVCPRD
jgi:hypothetical protein